MPQTDVSPLGLLPQLAAAVCLDALGSNATHMVICSYEGNRALNLAVQERQQVLLHQPAVRAALARKWRGERLHFLLEADWDDDDDVDDEDDEEGAAYFGYIGARKNAGLLNWLKFLGLIMLNLLVLPFVAFTPQLAGRGSMWSNVFPRHGYFLQVAWFQVTGDASTQPSCFWPTVRHKTSCTV